METRDRQKVLASDSCASVAGVVDWHAPVGKAEDARVEEKDAPAGAGAHGT